MFDMLKKLKYGARVFLSRKGGQEETIDLHGRPVVLHYAFQELPQTGQIRPYYFSGNVDQVDGSAGSWTVTFSGVH